MTKEEIKNQLQGGLVVSCQALEEEPLHSSMIMAKMALAAYQGGAKAIRANGINDIECIKKEVPLPIIGIIKREYPGSDVYITPTTEEIRALGDIQVDVIALDATTRKRPNGQSLRELVTFARTQYPNILLMADCASVEDIENANELGFDMVATTLVGYTKTTNGARISADDFKILKEMKARNKEAIFVVEGNIASPSQARQALEYGADTVVVGGMITRPQQITKCFVEAIHGK